MTGRHHGAIALLLCAVCACSEGSIRRPLDAWPEWTLPDVSIGALEAPAEQVFGSIDAIAVGGDGRLYVLDTSTASVSGFDAEGQFLFRVGGAGEGPRDLRNPASLALAGDTNLLVGQLTRSWKAFDLANPGAEDPEIASLPVSPFEMCALSSDVVVHGIAPDSENVVWVFRADGELDRAFGVQAAGESPLVRIQRSRGQIACALDATMVLYAPADSTVQSFSADGSPLWTATVPGFLSPTLTPQGGGSLIELPETGWHGIQTLLPWSREAFIVQVAYRTLESRARGDRWARLDTYTLDSRTGVLTRAPADVPELMAVTDEVIVAMSEDPYPRLTVWRR